MKKSCSHKLATQSRLGRKQKAVQQIRQKGIAVAFGEGTGQICVAPAKKVGPTGLECALSLIDRDLPKS